MPVLSMFTATATARYVLPVPAGPMQKTMSCLCMACMYRLWPAERGLMSWAL